MKKVKRITFDAYLKKIPTPIIFDHFTSSSRSKRKILSANFIEKVKDNFISQESITEKFKTLPLIAKRACAFSYLFGTKGLPIEGFEEIHESLLHSFLLYSATDSSNNQFYFGFEQMEPMLISEIVLFIQESCTTIVNNANPRSFLAMRCLSDLTIILILASQGVLKKKNDGTLIQNSFVTIKKLIHSTTENTIFVSQNEDDTAIIELLISYGKERGILSEDDKNITTTTGQIEKWLSTTCEKRYRDFIAFSVEYFCGWSMDILCKLFEKDINLWFSATLLPKNSEKTSLSILQIFHYVGIIDAISEGDAIFFKHCTSSFTSDFSNNTHGITILPDFSSVIPLEALPELIYSFSQLGQLSKLDMVYKGVINKESVYESLSIGFSEQTLLSLLADWNSPDNVVETVREWIREFFRLCLINLSTIIAIDEKTSQQLKAFPAFQDCIEPIPAHTVFTIKKGWEQEVASKLQSMGFDPRIPKFENPTEAAVEELFSDDNDQFEHFNISLEFNSKTEKITQPVPSGKYSEELKTLESSDLFHVIDYAILMGECLEFEYGGCSDIEKGLYLIKPSKLKTDGEAVLEGSTLTTKDTKAFLIKEIQRIGVKP